MIFLWFNDNKNESFMLEDDCFNEFFSGDWDHENFKLLPSRVNSSLIIISIFQPMTQNNSLIRQAAQSKT